MGNQIPQILCKELEKSDRGRYLVPLKVLSVSPNDVKCQVDGPHHRSCLHFKMYRGEGLKAIGSCP